MASDFNKPQVTDNYATLLDTVRDNDKANALMFNGISVTNIPVGAIQYASGVFNKWGGAAWSPELVSVSGGGTGASTAAGARAALDVYSKGEGDSRYLLKANNLSGLTDPALARGNLGADDAGNLTTGTVALSRLPASSTSAAGVVQLNNSTGSTSTTQAGTANAVKTAYDRVSQSSGLYTGGATGWVKYLGGSNFTRLVVQFSDPSFNSGNPLIGEILNWLPSNSASLHYASVFTARISSVNYEYRIVTSYDSYPTKKIAVNKINLSTGAETALTIASVYTVGDACAYLSDSTSGGGV